MLTCGCAKTIPVCRSLTDKRNKCLYKGTGCDEQSTEVRVEYVEIGVFLQRNISPQIRDPSVSAGIQHSIKGIFLPHQSHCERNNDMVRLQYDDDD